MTEHIAFLTGHLARDRLEKVLAGLSDPGFEWSVIDVGVKVAALMTEPIITNRLPRPIEATRVIVPGRCRVDLARLAAEFGLPFERGPEELKDLPAFFGTAGRGLDLSRHRIRIFSEIVDAPLLDVESILVRARRMQAAGADVIDLGCLPGAAFPHLTDTVRALVAEGFAVSVDSGELEQLREGARAGASYLLSLSKDQLDIAGETGAIPVLVPAPHGDLASLLEAAEIADKRGIRAMLDPVLDPIHFGFVPSLGRYAELRARLPDADILMGTGNLTELTDADSGGITALLIGICSELDIRNVLAVQVSPHTRRTLQEHDAARRIMFAAHEEHGLPRDYGAALLQLHDRRPFPNTPEEIAAVAREVRDRNFRIETAEDGIHVYAKGLHEVSTEALALFPRLSLTEDPAHAFYLGFELAKAEISWQLGKRYAQDEPLGWGCAVDRGADDLTRLSSAGHTLRRADEPDA